MKTITLQYKVYTLDELKAEAKEKALQELFEMATDYQWWNFIFDDAKNVGLKIECFDIYDRTIDGELEIGMDESIKAILKDHGEKTDTYATALEFKKRMEALPEIDIPTQDDEEAVNELEWAYKKTLLGNYLKSLTAEYAGMREEEYLKDFAEKNEYMFLEDGTLFTNL